ncbi:hypothetical protein FRC10_009484 [Ceratobasidium sp. 414]|nr:hypothetical protein FRC10_009484 [Ceratobasidium sp. 414]
MGKPKKLKTSVVPNIPVEDQVKVDLTNNKKEWLAGIADRFKAITAPCGKVDGSKRDYNWQTIMPQYFEVFYSSKSKEEQDRMYFHSKDSVGDDVRAEYDAKANTLRENMKAGKALMGEERVKYGKRFPAILNRILQEAYEKAGVLVTAHVAYEISDLKAMEIGIVATGVCKEYKKSDGRRDGLACWGNWLRNNGGMKVHELNPEVACYGDPNNENMPIMPDVPEDAMLSNR